MEVRELRIINLGEASGVSMDDVIMISSPTLGDRKIKLGNIVSTGGLITINMEDYEELSPQDIANNDYYIPDYDGYNMTDFPLFGTAQILTEGDMTAVEAPASKTVQTSWSGGGYIGCNIQYRNGLDITNIDEILFDLDLGTCYGGPTQTNPSWYYALGLLRSAPTGYIYANDSNFIASKKYNVGNTVYSNQSLDISSISGMVYPVIVAHGWNSSLSNFKIKSGYSGEAISKHGNIFVPV